MPSRALLPLALALSTLVLSACAMTEQDVRKFRETRCHYDGAFEQGMNDGRRGLEMDSQSLSTYCDPAQRAVIQGGYRDGYQAGLANHAAEAKAAARAAQHHADPAPPAGQPAGQRP
jgi:hypothetical protein